MPVLSAADHKISVLFSGMYAVESSSSKPELTRRPTASGGKIRPASRERQCTMARESLYLIERRVMQLEGISKIEVVLGGKMGLKEYKNR